MHLHPSLDEDVRLLFEALRQLLAERGYQRREMTWFSYTHELIRVFRFEPGLTWTHFAVGVSLRALDSAPEMTVWDSIRPLRCRVTHPQIEDCAVSVGLQRLVEDRGEFEQLTKFLDRKLTQPAAIPRIVGIVSDVALPFLGRLQTLEDVRKLVHSERASVLTIHEPAREILSCI